MSATPPEAPREDGGFLASPPLAAWGARARQALATGERRSFLGLGRSEIRKASAWPGEPVALSAHQPVLFYPGLWVKALAAGALADRLGWTAVHKVTDQDAPGEADGWIPVQSGEEVQTSEARLSRPGIPYALQTGPDPAAWTSLLRSASSSGWPSVAEAVGYFAASLGFPARERLDWDAWHLSHLGALDEACGTGRRYDRASRLWDTEAFLRFLSLWLAEPERLLGALNQALRSYRERNGIRHPLTPVPDLAFLDGWWETPFWTVAEGRERETLWIQSLPGRFVLRSGWTGETWEGSGRPCPDLLAKAPWRLWPKALPQSLYTRLFLADFMVHGLGGGFYEPVNDLFLEALGEPPAAPYGVATATQWVEPDRAYEAREQLRRSERIPHWRRAFEKNPEYLLTKAGEWAGELPPEVAEACRKASHMPLFPEAVAEKTALLEALRNPERRSQAGRALKDWNTSWTGRLAPLWGDFEKAREGREALAARWEGLSFRRYAFFCYPPGRWKAIRESVEGGFGGEKP